MKLPWSKILNAVGYQTVWFATLYSASKGYFWLGFLASVLFSSLMLCFGGNAKQDSRIVLIGLVLGISIDSIRTALVNVKYCTAVDHRFVAFIFIYLESLDGVSSK